MHESRPTLWLKNASASGWKTTTSATEGSIGAVIVWSGGKFGHVGIVVDMYPSGRSGEITYAIKEMNWGAVIDEAKGITANFGVVSDVTLTSSKLGRGSSYPFAGFVLPARN